MEAIRVQQIIQKRGELIIRNLPVEKGQQVEVLLMFAPSEIPKRPRLTARQLLHSELIGLGKIGKIFLTVPVTQDNYGNRLKDGRCLKFAW